jgi:hypothetical protein
VVLGLAVPVETVTGLAKGRGKQAVGSGAALEMPTSRPSPSTAAVAASRAQDILRAAWTLHMARRARLRPVAARGCTAIPGTQTCKAMSAPPAIAKSIPPRLDAISGVLTTFRIRLEYASWTQKGTTDHQSYKVATKRGRGGVEITLGRL